MKKILVAVVLGLAVVAGAQDAAQPAQSSAQGQAPVIKDPAEYNAYVGAYQQKDPAAQISGLEAFLTQYPNSVMKTQALEILMGAYQQTGNTKKTMETATKLVTADPCQLRALALLAYLDRVLAQGGDPNGQQLLTDGKKYGAQGLGCLDKTTDAEMVKMKPQMSGIFYAAEGIADLTAAGKDKENPQQQAQDYDSTIKELTAALNANADNQKDFSLVYPLTLAYWPDPKVPATPENSRNAIWYAARASAVAPAGPTQAQIEKYAKSLYRRFHGDEDGWPDFLAKAKAGTMAPPDLATLIPPAPTPADQAHKMVTDTTPDKMDFAQWEFVLMNGSQADQDTVWNAIKGKPVQMVGMVISTTPDTFMVAGSSDDIDAKKADITLKFEDKLPVKMIPKDATDNFQFQGEPASYTSNPFMMVMEKGRLLNAKPAATTPAHHPPVHKKPAAQ